MSNQGDQKIREKIVKILEKLAKTVTKQKYLHYIKAQFKSPKHLHQTTFEPLKYLQ
jgi:hypothetical protein